MDKAALQDLFAYTGWAWDEIKRAIGDDATLSRVAPGSGWPALRNCLAHIISAYDSWIPALTELKRGQLPRIADEDFLTWPQMDAHRSRTRDDLERLLDGWTDADLQEQHEVDIDGRRVRYSRGELILHLFLHERGHHGDVTTLFWQLGIEAETELEYRFHLRRH